MKAYVLLFFGVFLAAQAILATNNASKSPDCVPKCWNNSKYVSSCTNEKKCLCEDNAFQGAVFQCLYSQCQTAQFGSALHFALAECSSFDTSGPLELPPLIRQLSVRKRGSPNSEDMSSSATGLVSGYLSASAIYSVTHRHVSGSGFAYTRTRSTGPSHTHSRKPSSFETTTTVPSTSTSMTWATGLPASASSGH